MVEGGVEAVACPGQGGREGFGGKRAVCVRVRGQDGQRVVVGADSGSRLFQVLGSGTATGAGASGVTEQSLQETAPAPAA